MSADIVGTAAGAVVLTSERIIDWPVRVSVRGAFCAETDGPIERSSNRRADSMPQRAFDMTM
jgi:hypothetical protein